jgi:hypothetical protein
VKKICIRGAVIVFSIGLALVVSGVETKTKTKTCTAHTWIMQKSGCIVQYGRSLLDLDGHSYMSHVRIVCVIPSVSAYRP